MQVGSLSKSLLNNFVERSQFKVVLLTAAADPIFGEKDFHMTINDAKYSEILYVRT